MRSEDLIMRNYVIIIVQLLDNNCSLEKNISGSPNQVISLQTFCNKITIPNMNMFEGW